MRSVEKALPFVLLAPLGVLACGLTAPLRAVGPERPNILWLTSEDNGPELGCYGDAFVSYMFETPSTRRWRELFDAGLLNEAPSAFWRTKPAEELYDLETDPDQVRNLAESPEHQALLEKFHAALRSWILESRDLGFLPEGEMHARAGGVAPWHLGRDDSRYPLERVLAAAELATSNPGADAVPRLIESMRDPDGAVRYWGVLGLLIAGREAAEPGRGALLEAMADESADVRIVAAEALARFGAPADAGPALELLLDEADVTITGLYRAMAPLNAIDAPGEGAASQLEALRRLPRNSPELPSKLDGYIGSLLDRILSR